MKQIWSLFVSLTLLSGCELILGETSMMDDMMMPGPLTLSGMDGNVMLDSAPCASAEYTYEVSGGTPPYAFSLSAPNELNAMGTLGMDGSYQISVGVNGAIGSWAMNVTVQDSTGATAEKMVVFANATAFTVSSSGDDLVTSGEITQVSAIASIESMTVATEFAWTVQTSPMGSSLTSGSVLMGTTSGSNSSVDITPDVSGDYEIGVTATQGACTASTSFALRAREECTSSVTVSTMDGDIQLNQRTVVTGTYDAPSGNETYEWRLTKPDGTEENLMVETFENQSGVVFGANAYFTPASAGSYQLQFKVIDEDCEYTGSVSLRAIPQAFVLSRPKTTFVLDYVGDRDPPSIEGRHQYGDENSYQSNPSSFGGYGGYKTEVSLLFPENMVEVSADCTSANLGGCNWWDSTGMNEYMGNWTSSFTESSAVLLSSGGFLGWGAATPSPMTVEAIYIRDARPMPSIATATKSFHFRHREEVPYAIYDSSDNVLPAGEMVVSEGASLRMEITAGYFNAPLTFVIESDNPLLTLSSTTIVFPPQSEGMSQSIMLTAAQDMDTTDHAAVISIREINNASVSGDSIATSSYTSVSTQIHIQDDDRVDSCMLSATTCWVEFEDREPPAGRFFCDPPSSMYTEKFAVNVMGGSGMYEFHFHERVTHRGEVGMTPGDYWIQPDYRYRDFTVGLSASTEGVISEYVECSGTGSTSCDWNVLAVDLMTGCAVRHGAEGTDIF